MAVPTHQELQKPEFRIEHFNDRIVFYLPYSGDVSLRVYDICGRLEGELLNGAIEGGSHIVKLPDMRNGIYFVRLIYNNELHTAKFVSIK